MTDDQRHTLTRLERKLDALLKRQEKATAGPRLQYSKAEAAYALDCSERWLDTLEKNYGLRSCQLGSKRYYSHAELERFVASNGGQAARDLEDMLQQHRDMSAALN